MGNFHPSKGHCFLHRISSVSVGGRGGGGGVRRLVAHSASKFEYPNVTKNCKLNFPEKYYTCENFTTSLQTSRQQVVFAWLVTSCQQVWNKLLTTCNNLVDIITFVTRLFQQGCYNHDITILLQPCVVNLVTFLLYHDCIRLVRTTL